MSETSKTGFLIRGTKEKSEGDVFQGHNLHQIPIWTCLRIAFPCFILREQFGNRYASTVWLYWNIIDVMDSFFPLFPYLLLYRTEEDAGSSPARSTRKPLPMGVCALRYLQIGVWGLLRDFRLCSCATVCNCVITDFTNVITQIACDETHTAMHGCVLVWALFLV